MCKENTKREREKEEAEENIQKLLTENFPNFI